MNKYYVIQSFPHRHSQRIIHIPFFPPTKCLNPTELRENELSLKEARNNASAGIGILISIGRKIVAPDWQEHLNNTVLPYVMKELPRVHFRVQKSYALLLVASELVRNNSLYTCK